MARKWIGLQKSDFVKNMVSGFKRNHLLKYIYGMQLYTTFNDFIRYQTIETSDNKLIQIEEGFHIHIYMHNEHANLNPFSFWYHVFFVGEYL